MCEPPDYEGIVLNLWPERAKEVIPELRSNDELLLKRIRTFVERFQFPEADVKNEIMTNSMFAATFAKNPTRQKIHESIAVEWLNKHLNSHVKLLPAAGKDALYITKDGNIVQSSERKDGSSKSIDFRWKQGQYTVYATHKYTKDSGGAQDNQFADARKSLENFLHADDQSIIFLAIVDGAYYNNKKMAELERVTRHEAPRSYAVHIEEVPDLMKNLP